MSSENSRFFEPPLPEAAATNSRGGRLLLRGALMVAAALAASSGHGLASDRDSREPNSGLSSIQRPTAELVRLALENEVAGRAKERDVLLREALAQTPDDASARWQAGQVSMGGQWLSPADVARAARQDRRLAQYARLRDTAGPIVADQAGLARWCRKNRLSDEQRVQWMRVLQLQPNNGEAIQALGLRPYRGMMLTQEQIKQLNEQQRSVRKAVERWRPVVLQWRKTAEDGERAMPAEVREQVGRIDNAADMVALEGDLWQQVGAKRKSQLYHDMGLQMMRALGDNRHPAAAESLARYAAFSGFADVRAAAAAGLKRHPLDHYVPLLLSGLQSPIEASMQWTLNDVGDLITQCSFFQEGALADVSGTLMRSPVYSDGDNAALPPVSVAPGTGTVAISGTAQARQALMRNDPGAVAAAYAQASADAAAAPQQVANAKAANAVAAAVGRRMNAQRAVSTAVRNQAAMRDAVDRVNRGIAERNARLVAVLHDTTGLDLGSEPMAWWGWWWQDYNEMYKVSSSSEPTDPGESPKPEYHYDAYQPYQGSSAGFSPISSVGNGAVGLNAVTPGVASSCFTPGTKVWTLTGQQPIEKIRVGDRVLAQDVESGELGYKPVLAVTTRPPVRWMKIGLGKEAITATPSHPFWVSGKGWEMTKQLKAGSLVHTPSGSVPVESVEKLESRPEEAVTAYNLIVADFSSYFVGDQGILVHDNTPRKPTAALLPGLPGRPTPVNFDNGEHVAHSSAK
jgi:hypothetical protein